MASVIHCTWSQNLAPSNRPPLVLAGVAWLANSLFDGPSAEALCAATVTDLGANVVSESPAPWFTALTSRTGTDPRLLLLADNGGPTWTMALAADSPAVDAANAVFSPALDARGVSRPIGQASDLGAYEFGGGFSPAITIEPENLVLLVRDTGTFSVAATGTPPLNYRWRKESPDGTWAWVTGATNAVLTFTNVQLAAAGDYRAVVSNPWGTVTSRAAVLRVIQSVWPVDAVLTVSGWAGTGLAGSVDGPGSVARFDGPSGLDVDAAGHVYVADANNHRIRRIAPDGTVTTMAGSGVDGYADGMADQARFSHPRGVSVDAAGQVFVADAGNNRVRKIDAGGRVSTVAGTGVGGYRDGPGPTAWLNSPNDLVVDGAGILWVTEFDNHTVRRIGPDGTVSTWVGNGQAGSVDGARAEARLTQPGGIALDSEGNLYVTEYGGHRVRKVSAAGVVSTVAGTGVAGYLDGEGAKAQFRNPDGLVVGALGYVYVADNGNHAVRRMSATGYVETVAVTEEAGSEGGVGPAAQFWNPTGIGLGENGVLYVTDGMNQQVRRLSPPGLQLLRLGDAVVVNWTGEGWMLQVSTQVSLGTAWRDVAGQTNGSVTVPIEAAASRFYRLRDVSLSRGSGTPDIPANPDP